MKPGEYWRKRFRLLEEVQNDTSVKKAHEVQEQFHRSQAVIENKINAWYQRLADNNGVSMIKARELLRKNELEEFRWSVEEYIKAGKENAKNQAWQKELENASAKVHISRLEALKMQTQAEVEKLFGNVTDAVDGHIRGTYENGFYHTAYEIQKGIGIGSPIQRLDGRTVDKIVSKPWAVDGKDFSGRIWENRTKLVNKLNNSLTKMCITGASPDAAIHEMATSMKVSRKQAVKVIMTESAAFSNLARKECMDELDVEQFEVVETLDGITCKVCTEMDGKHYPMSEYVIGVTAPPFHPLCRGCTCPYFNDEFSQDGGRAARGADGRTYYVPADMTFKDWKESFVDGVDFEDKTVLLSKIKDYEEKIVNSPVENAVIITKQGRTKQFCGELNSVHIGLNEGLQGAYVTHNHPIGSVNEYSFSKQDINLFVDSGISVLRGIDSKFVYELTRNPLEIDEHVPIWDWDEYSTRHDEVISIAEKLGIGYRRYPRE